MKNFILFLALSISTLAFTNVQAMGLKDMTLGQKILFNIEMKRKLTGKSKTKKRAPVNCAEVFQKQKTKYLDDVCNGESRYMEVGYISKKFTKDEIQNMPARHPHLVTSVRGTNQLVRKSSLSGRPSFPHANQRCEDFFTEEVEVVEVDGKSCRQITFTAPEVQGSYVQQYCEEDMSIFMYFE